MPSPAPGRRSAGERPGEVPDRVGPGTADGVVERDAVWRLLATLQARQRAVLVLRYWEGLPDREIAGLLGFSEGTVRNHLSAAIGKTGATTRAEAARIAQERGWL